MRIAEAIRCIVAGNHLTEEQAAAVACEIMSGSCAAAQIAALLIGLRMKGESVDEVVGFAKAMRSGAQRMDLSAPDLVDTCGTGGDGCDTFNISTVAAFVAAGAGCKVAKHGNRSVSSKCGSADVLTELGVDIQMPAETTAECIATIGVGFLFAPQYHPGARHAAAARKQIGVRSIFNLLGPLLNPAGARRQVMGVYDRALTIPLAQVLRRLGSSHCLVVARRRWIGRIVVGWSHPGCRTQERGDSFVRNHAGGARSGTRRSQHAPRRRCARERNDFARRPRRDAGPAT